MEDYTPRIVLLLPSLDEIKRRSADFGPRLTEEETLWTYEEAMRLSVYDERIDNTGLTPEEVAIKLARGWNP